MPSTVARILKVNHGGEHGASRIYAAQIAAARWRCPDLVPELADLLAHERRHERMFLDLMPSRAARPCRLMPLWALGGFALGLMTGLLGRTGVFVCTEAVERTVHRHLDHQLTWLTADPARADSELTEVIAMVQTEEEGHLAWAAARRPPQSPATRVLYVAVAATVEALIWMSTQGESGRLEREMRSDNSTVHGTNEPSNRQGLPYVLAIPSPPLKHSEFPVIRVSLGRRGNKHAIRK